MTETKHTPTADELVAAIDAGMAGTTPGPWFEGAGWVFVPPKDAEKYPMNALRNIFRDVAEDELQPNVAHVARCSPDNIRIVLAELDRLRNSHTALVGALMEAIEIFERMAVNGYVNTDVHAPAGSGYFIPESVFKHLRAALAGEKDAPDDGWIEWKGGECPVEDLARVDIKFRDGLILSNERSDNWRWTHGTDMAADAHIIAYRISRP